MNWYDKIIIFLWLELFKMKYNYLFVYEILKNTFIIIKFRKKIILCYKYMQDF